MWDTPLPGRETPAPRPPIPKPPGVGIYRVACVSISSGEVLGDSLPESGISPNVGEAKE